jgi:F-type H+-transporting ATPase subunit a
MEQNWLTALLNHWLGPAVTRALALIGVHVSDPANPLPTYFVMAVVVVLLGMAIVLLLKPRISVERPGAAQQVAEMLLTNPMGFGVRDLLEDSGGHQAVRFVPLVGTIGIFVLLSNLISLIPAFESPTGHPSVPLACAIIVFLYYNWQGLHHHGPVGYAKHFAGPVWWMSWLIFPVEIISHTARLLSLTVRLWANIFSSELLYVTFLGLLMAPSLYLAQKNTALGYAMGIFPAILPIIFMGLHAFVAIIQAFVFTILPAIYLGMATAEEH